jgi:hypothetical protein
MKDLLIGLAFRQVCVAPRVVLTVALASGKKSSPRVAHLVMRADTRSQLPGSNVAEPCVLEWRREQLAAASFPPELAAEIAADRRYDLHALIELVERGCAPALAARILAPDIR